MQFRYVVTGLAVVMGLAGCQRTSYDYNNNASNIRIKGQIFE